MSTTKPNCYECIYRGNVPGSAHSSCNHPATKEVRSNPLAALLAGFGGACIPTELNVIGNEHGIRNGWFGHPLNFDPVWLERCDGYTPKESANDGVPSTL